MPKNQNAQALGALGGKARAQKLSPERRMEISRKANEVKAQKKLSTDLE